MEKYEILYHIANGYFGSVYAGIRSYDGLPVAIKKVKENPSMYATCSSGDIVWKEPYFLSKVKGVKGCVRLLEAETGDDGNFLVMERPEKCCDLFEIIRNGGPLPPKRLQHIFKQIVEACLGCLKLNVVHGDLKPENVIVDLQTDEATLIDFGFARYVNRRVITACDGTDEYLPPEVHKQGCIFHLPAAAVWSLGLMLFEMSTGSVDGGGVRPCFDKVKDPNLKSLLDSMLKVDCTERATLQVVKDHPWMTAQL